MASVVDELDEEVGSDIPPWKLPALSGPAEGDQIVKKNHFTETNKKKRTGSGSMDWPHSAT